ncbi:uncharacterized protein FOMMEDRAFT_135268 [Fomitiporia mediterranea MF3/22]|uniref:uncharacterized protein n=1 Tax=Fomitiporia mediterranea (strain MF3/22) TaxID=694068 RepID=UPI0004408E9C|nr:uncharacterized protein FOMMEDRAFT_135268 [Fomitiporia mediterranea MF3/22]EJD00995.1 hypothetical protein FOMMEDRAFT_135268 [Fomitiporia mediterranea MF3/22]
MTEGTKWAPGSAYGPVLSPTELYLLNPKLELHPVLTGKLQSFHLVFHLVSGRATGYNADSRDHDLDFAMRDEVATLPRVTELIIICPASPWCTVVHNPNGVSLSDILGKVWKDYMEHALTEDEFSALPPPMQDRVRRSAVERETRGNSRFMSGWGTADYPYNRCKRIDWLRDKVFFDYLERDDEFARARLGYAAPNVFKMMLMS